MDGKLLRFCLSSRKLPICVCHQKEGINQQREKWDPGNRGSIWQENFQDDERKSQDNHWKKAEKSSKK